MSKAVRIWEDNFEILSKIRSKSERNALCFALISYGFSGKIPQDLNLNKNNLLLFEVLKNNFIAKNQGGRPTEKENSFETDSKPLSENRKQKVDIQSSDKSSDCIKPRKVEKFVKPTIDEVKAYCKERNNGVDAERWFDWYEANGWRSGKNPMKDWRAAVRTWERGSENVKAVSSGFSDIVQRTPEQEEESRKMALMVEATKRALAEKMRLKFGA